MLVLIVPWVVVAGIFRADVHFPSCSNQFKRVLFPDDSNELFYINVIARGF